LVRISTETLAILIKKISGFWGITLCSPLTFNLLHGFIFRKRELFIIRIAIVLVEMRENLRSYIS
jgi:hypothetical protein